MKFLAFFLLLISLVLEASLTTIPFVFLVLLVFIAISRANWLFVLAFIFGILLDLVGFKTLGMSSIFFLVFLFLVLLYQSKFEIATNAFVWGASFVGSFVYLVLFGGNQNLLLQAVLSSIIGLLLFKLIQRTEFKNQTENQHLRA
jgi:cell shape-determining protein MreD